VGIFLSFIHHNTAWRRTRSWINQSRWVCSSIYTITIISLCRQTCDLSSLNGKNLTIKSKPSSSANADTVLRNLNSLTRNAVDNILSWDRCSIMQWWNVLRGVIVIFSRRKQIYSCLCIHFYAKSSNLFSLVFSSSIAWWVKSCDKWNRLPFFRFFQQCVSFTMLLEIIEIRLSTQSW